MNVRALFLACCSALWLTSAFAQEAVWQALRGPGSVLLFRHALAPGGGDPPGFALQDCSTQRNLSAEGRAQARRIGERLRAENITVGQVLHSEWCRTRDTAQLAFGTLRQPQLRPDSRFNSFFQDPGKEPAQTAAARAVLQAWRGPGVLVVVTHQVNITAFTGVVPDSGEGVVLQVQGGQLRVVGRVQP